MRFPGSEFTCYVVVHGDISCLAQDSHPSLSYPLPFNPRSKRELGPTLETDDVVINV